MSKGNPYHEPAGSSRGGEFAKSPNTAKDVSGTVAKHQRSQDYSEDFLKWNNAGRVTASPDIKKYGLTFSQALAEQDKLTRSGALAGDYLEKRPPMPAYKENPDLKAKYAARAKALGLK